MVSRRLATLFGVLMSLCFPDVLTIIQGSEIRVMLAVSGGGCKLAYELAHVETPKAKVVEMVIAPGGLIKQTILEDPVQLTDWDLESTITFNVQLLRASVFKRLLGIEAPTTPVTAELYKQHGHPFFKLYEEKSGIEGHFGGIKSIGGLEKEKRGVKRGRDEDIDFPVVELNTVKKRTPSVPIGEMARKLKIV